MEDHLGADAFDELMRHVDAVGFDLERFGARQNDSTRAHVSALGVRMEASERTELFGLDGDLKREARVLMPLLVTYLESATADGAA